MRDAVQPVVGHVFKTQVLAKLVGRECSFAKIVASIPDIAKHARTVLITGETGTGKELVARAIHYLSDRAGHPFVTVNCASLPDSLIEDALFGHEAGAFTDARATRRGLLGEANGGTLFLDEVEALSHRAQAALLRVLQDGTFHALGSPRERRTDIRVLAATNAPLDQLVHASAFRSDLYHRLRVLFIDLPPLRERKGDILLLAKHFLDSHTPPGKGPLDLDETAKAALVEHAWPGNVRELENAVLRATVVCQTNLIGQEDLGIPSSTLGSSGTTSRHLAGRALYRVAKRETIAAFERSYLTELMEDHHGNVTHAARAAGKERRELGRLLRKHGVNPQVFRTA
jgi:DNA-binding NtrC family response regulator